MPKYHREPELVSSVRTINKEGEEAYIGDRISSVFIIRGDEQKTAVAQIDVRDFRKGTNLVIEIPLPDLVAAISSATLEADGK